LVSLQSLRVELIKYADQPFDVANRMTISDAKSVLDSDAFENWKKSRDNQTAIQLAIVSRLDALIKRS
jgi:hypothetical protein